MEKKHSGFLKFLKALVITILVLAILPTALFLTLKLQKLTLDDPEQCASTPSTGSREHLSFTSDADMTVSFDKNDLWFFISRKYAMTIWTISRKP